MSYVKQVDHRAELDLGQPIDFLAVGLFQDAGIPASVKPVDRALDGLIGKVLAGGDFKGKRGQSLVLFSGGTPARVALVGLGEEDKFTSEVARQAAGTAVGLALKHNLTTCGLLAITAKLPEDELSQAQVEGLILGSYRFTDHKKQDDDSRELKRLSLYGPASGAAVERGTIVGNSTCLTRDLQNQPSNIATPSFLAKEAQRIAKSALMRCTVWDREQFTAKGMGALAGVARGSHEPPKFIVLEYDGGKAGAPPLALVGKGITFDSGGISLKPGAKMDEMKFDMSGAAAVLGIMDAVAHLKPAINLVGVIASTENLPGGNAQKPGDIVTAYNGKTIEVLNTDAEGRLILADALAYVVDQHKPGAILDFATLTGAVLVALGHRASGLMGNDEALIAEVLAAGEKTGERVWQLPMWDEYTEDIKSDVADVKNLGTERLAGTIAGGAFLKEFVGETPWAHLDIAGTAWQDKDQPYIPSGGSGVAVRLVVQLILDRVVD